MTSLRSLGENSVSIIQCSKCGLMVSTTAAQCPGCKTKAYRMDSNVNVPSLRADISIPTQTATPQGRGHIDIWELPKLAKGQHLDLKAIRVPYEGFYLFFVTLPTLA